jgi:protein CpxP
MRCIFRALAISVAISVGALFSFAGFSLANEGGWGGEHGYKHEWGAEHFEKHFDKIVKKLGLTDEQQTKAKALFEANKPVVKELKEKLHAEKKTLHEVMHADKFDEAAIRAESAKVAAIYADLNVNKAKVCADFRALLTPDQAKALKAWYEEHMKKCKEHKEKEYKEHKY